MKHLLGGALGIFGLIAMGIGAVASNQMNDYSGSLALQAAGVKVKRPYIAALVILLAFGLILWMHTGSTAQKFTNLLLFTGYWVAPFVAIVMIDWHYRRRSLTPKRLWASLDFRNLENGWSALAALLIGFGAMVPFMNTELIVGPVAKALDGADLSFYVGFVVTAVAYYVLRESISAACRRRRPSTIPRSPRWARRRPNRARIDRCCYDIAGIEGRPSGQLQLPRLIRDRSCVEAFQVRQIEEAV